MGRWVTVIIILIIVAAGIVIGVTYRSNNNKTTTTSPSANSSQSAQSKNQAPMTAKVNIINMLFTPSQVSVAKGGTVTWTNNDSVTHTVVDDLSNVGGPNSGNIAPGTAYSFTFDKAGSYQYHCSIHPSMRGTIVVK